MTESNALIELIGSIVDSKINTAMKSRPKLWVVTVVTATVAPNANASVNIEGDITSTITLKNKSWETLSSGDEAYALSTTGSLSDAVIVYKK